MKLLRTFSLGVVLFFLALPGLGLRAEDWTTTDGKVYKDVKVVKLEADAVTILHQDGGALVPLASLPPALQQRFNYDPEKAKAAAAERAKADGTSATDLAAERIEAQKLQAAKEAKYKADKKAVEDAKAAAAALPAGNGLPVGQFGLETPSDPNHKDIGQALAPNDPKLPMPSQPTSH